MLLIIDALLREFATKEQDANHAIDYNL